MTLDAIKPSIPKAKLNTQNTLNSDFKTIYRYCLDNVNSI